MAASVDIYEWNNDIVTPLENLGWDWIFHLYCAWNSSCTKEPGAGCGDPSGAFSSSTGGWKNKRGTVQLFGKEAQDNAREITAGCAKETTSCSIYLYISVILFVESNCVAIYLPWRSALRVDDVVEVFMNSIQQPEEKFLGIVLGVTLELKGALWHHILQQIRKNRRGFGV